MITTLNANAAQRFSEVLVAQRTSTFRVHVHTPHPQVTLVDAGIDCIGSLEAGRWLSQLCMGDAATISFRNGDGAVAGVHVEVQTDQPVAACLGAQYAGWPLKVGKYFAMASGPMRMGRGREPLLQKLQLAEPESDALVGVLETDHMPSHEVLETILQEGNAGAKPLFLAVAPTRSLAGSIQVVSRSVETAMHKLDELGFDVTTVLSGIGIAPLPPPAKDSMTGIGRTNDAILYGGRVTLYVDAATEEVARIGPLAPSQSSRDFGRPFLEIFKDYNYDFYKIDPLLFSPAELTIINLRDGRSQTFGHVHPEILRQSYLG